MAEPTRVEGKKPDREIPADKIGKLELASDEASGRTSPFWVKCWSCHKYLSRPLSPPDFSMVVGPEPSRGNAVPRRTS